MEKKDFGIKSLFVLGLGLPLLLADVLLNPKPRRKRTRRLKEVDPDWERRALWRATLSQRRVSLDGERRWYYERPLAFRSTRSTADSY